MNKYDKPSTARASHIRQWLRDHGMSTSDTNTLIRITHTMFEITNDLRAYLRQRKKNIA
jgi:hypothetical protein